LVLYQHLTTALYNRNIIIIEIKFYIIFIEHVNISQCLYLLLQAQPVPIEVLAKMLGNRVAVSPIVTVEPRRRKFHKPITLTIPVPKAAQKGMLNQYGGETPTLRLLCSIIGEKMLETLFIVCICVSLLRLIDIDKLWYDSVFVFVL